MRFQVTDTATGEIVSFEDAINKLCNEEIKEGWEKTHQKQLLRYYSVADSPSIKVLNYLLTRKKLTCLIYASQTLIVEETGVTKNTVSKIIRALIKQNLLKRVRTGVYIINPDISVHGNYENYARSMWRNGRD